MDFVQQFLQKRKLDSTNWVKDERAARCFVLPQFLRGAVGEGLSGCWGGSLKVGEGKP